MLCTGWLCAMTVACRRLPGMPRSPGIPRPPACTVWPPRAGWRKLLTLWACVSGMGEVCPGTGRKPLNGLPRLRNWAVYREPVRREFAFWRAGTRCGAGTGRPPCSPGLWNCGMRQDGRMTRLWKAGLPGMTSPTAVPTSRPLAASGRRRPQEKPSACLGIAPCMGQSRRLLQPLIGLSEPPDWAMPEPGWLWEIC